MILIALINAQCYTTPRVFMGGHMCECPYVCSLVCAETRGWCPPLYRDRSPHWTWGLASFLWDHVLLPLEFWDDRWADSSLGSPWVLGIQVPVLLLLLQGMIQPCQPFFKSRPLTFLWLWDNSTVFRFSHKPMESKEERLEKGPDLVLLHNSVAWAQESSAWLLFISQCITLQ